MYMAGVLTGVRVLDLSRILAGPYCTQMLADLGAEVTKVEAPWGDDTRGWGPPFLEDGTAAYHLSCNRGKQIVFHNLKEDKAEIQKLISQSDIVVENFRPGQLERLIGPIPKDVILCSITGFGQTGPRSQEPGYDLALQAMSGIMSITGEKGGGPVKVGVAWIDIITGLYAGNAILASLFHREKTGVCNHLDISLWDCAIASLANQGQNQIVSGDDPGLLGSGHPNLVPYQAFEASDGWVVIAVGSDSQFAKLSELLEFQNSWPTNQNRVDSRQEVVDLVQSKVSEMNRSQVCELLQGIPTSPINKISEALSDIQSIARNVIGDWQGHSVLASPLRFISERE
ncbi:MAG: CoA transferase [Candidatus Poseidoniales archaeon]|nr:MAG: CoA transferase [Candidatus Poseidoniales archaeon]